MSHYVIRRTVQAIPLLIGIRVIVFVLLQMTPGGPLAIAENPGGSGRVIQEQLERLRAKYGLDDPLYMRYLHWAGDLVRGDWGTSFNTGQPVLAMIGERIPATLLLTGLASLVTLILAFPIGIISAARQYSLFDYIATTAAFLGIAVPSFWLALMFLYVFTFSLGWLPAVGLGDPRQQYEGFAAVVDRARHLIMPVSVLALVSTASLTRYVRAAMLDVLGQDYMRTARGKGLTERAALMRHALKNAAIPVVTILALEIPDLFIGSVIVESIFAISGMGRLFVESADLRDYPVLMGILLIASFLVILFNLIADILYSRLDPRIRYR